MTGTDEYLAISDTLLKFFFILEDPAPRSRTFIVLLSDRFFFLILSIDKTTPGSILFLKTPETIEKQKDCEFHDLFRDVKRKGISDISEPREKFISVLKIILGKVGKNKYFRSSFYLSLRPEIMQDFLDTNITYLSGVGPKRAELLNKELNIFTYRDLLYYFPYKYIDRTRFYKISELDPDLPSFRLKGAIKGYSTEGRGAGKRLVADFQDDTGSIKAGLVQGSQMDHAELSIRDGIYSVR